jgi:carbonic anhydrase/acetyltransferase-like protein (isoleucine patch superfamily)
MTIQEARYRKPSTKQVKAVEAFVNKYELTARSKIFRGEKVYHIRALKDFGDVCKGDFGGWVASEANLSQYGDCWLEHEAVAMGNSRIRAAARVMDYAVIKENAVVEGECTVCERAVIAGDAVVTGGMVVAGNTVVGGKTKLKGISVAISSNEELMVFALKQKQLRGH